MLKTIRLSKNIFSLTERLPKAKYRSPKVFMGGSDGESNSLLPQLTNQKNRNHNMSTVQPPGSEDRPLIKQIKSKSHVKSKSRL